MFFKKIVAYIRWFLMVIPLEIFSFTALIIYPIAYIIDKLGWFNPLWVYLDDEIKHEATNKDFILWAAANGGKKSFITLYRWHAVRNRIWNARQYFKPRRGRLNCVWNIEKIVEVKKDTLTRNGKKVDINGLCLEDAGFKWIDKFGNEGWQVFSGVKISEKYSTKGTLYMFYTVRNKLYFRYTHASIFSIWGGQFLIEFKIGTSEKRYLLTFKIKKL